MSTQLEEDIWKIHKKLKKLGWKLEKHSFYDTGGTWVKKDSDGYHIFLRISTHYDDYEQLYGIVKDDSAFIDFEDGTTIELTTFDFIGEQT